MPSRAVLDEKILPLHRVIRTERPEEMRDFMRAEFNVTHFRIRSDGNPFRGQVNRTKFDRVGLLYFGYDTDVRIEFPESPDFRLLICLNGAAEVNSGGVVWALAPNEMCLAPPGPMSSHYKPGCRQLVLQIPPDALRAKLEALLGANLSRDLEFDRQPGSPTNRQQFLRKLVLFYAMELDSMDGGSSAVLKNALEQTLLMAFLYGNKNNYSFMLEASPSEATPKTIWLVESYIEANWNKPITIEEIADITGINARSIFHAFKTYRGYSPMAFAKERRLERAREILSRGEGGLSVSRAAFACGFESHGHFSREYKKRFGELPSATVSRT